MHHCVLADADWDKEWTSPSNTAQTKVSPNIPRPASRSGSATSLRSNKAAAQAADGPNGGSWAGWDDQPAAAAAASTAAAPKKDEADDWGKW